MTLKQRRHGLHKHERMMRLYAQFMRAGDVVFDVGANAGTRTEVFAELGARVIAIEPQKECLRQLYIQFHENPRVTIVPKALGATVGQAEMQIANESQLSSMNPAFVEVMTPRVVHGNVKWSETRTVPVTTLDALIQEYGQPAFVKIDVEGFENQVMAGLSSPIAACAFEFQPHYLISALQSIERFEQLGVAWYNYYLEEQMEFQLAEWVSAAEMQGLLKSFEHTNDFLMGEVYARRNVPAPHA